MPLEKQSIPVSFGQGVDTKTDPKQVVPGKMLVLENAIFQTPQQITKRNGYQKLATAGTDAYGMASYEDELLAFDGNLVRSYSAATADFKSKGAAVSVEVETKSVVANSYAQTSQDACYHTAGLKVYAWEDGRGGIRYSVIDADTGHQLVADAVCDAGGSRPKPFALGNYVLIVYYDGTGMAYKKISVTSPTTLSSKVALSTNVVGANPNWDGAVIGARLFLAWHSTVSTNSVTLAYLTSTLVLSATDSTANAITGGVSIWGDSAQNVWVAWYNGTKVRCLAKTYDLAALVSATDVATVSNVRNVTGTATAALTALVLYEVSASNTYDYLTYSCTLTRASSTITPGTPAVFLRSVGLASRIFEYNSAFYVVMAYESTYQPTYFVASTSGAIIAKIAPLAGGGLTKKSLIPNVTLIGTSDFLVGLLTKQSLQVVSGRIYALTSVIGCTVKFISDNTFLYAEGADALHINGGILAMYDGVNVIEHGFHLFPEQAAAPTPSASGGSMSNGTYLYCFTYEWSDNKGNIHRSAPSIAQSVSMSGGGSSQSLAWALPTLRLTQKSSTFSRSAVQICVYRTVASGTIYYKVTSPTSPTYNSTTADTVAFTDTVSDASLVGNELLYTTGGVLENIAAPSPALVCTYRNRVIVVPADNRKEFWLSKAISPGRPVEFSDSLVKSIDPLDGDITAVSQTLDEKLILFKRNSTWATAGEGPADTGTGDDMGAPQRVTTDAGCTNPRSIVITPAGLMRQTVKGIYLLDRSLQDTYIGAPVEDYNSETISAAILVPDTNQVRFTTESGTCLVYDYLMGQWSVFTGLEAVGAAVYQNRFCYLDPDGRALQETPGVYADDARFIPIKLKTSWLSFAGLQGFARVYQLLMLGEYKSAHQLILTVAYDFNESPEQQTYIDAGTLLQPGAFGDDSTYGSGTPYGGDFPLYQFRLFMKRQKCQAVQVGLEETQNGTAGEGFTLSAFTFLVGLKSGTYKVPASRSFG